MITIQCWYTECPEGKFDWDWPEPIDYESAQSGEMGAKWKSALCPHCNQLNWVLVKPKKKRLLVKVPSSTELSGHSEVPIHKAVPVAKLEGRMRSGGFEP